jgi:hypothetical protein
MHLSADNRVMITQRQTTVWSTTGSYAKTSNSNHPTITRPAMQISPSHFPAARSKERNLLSFRTGRDSAIAQISEHDTSLDSNARRSIGIHSLSDMEVQ